MAENWAYKRADLKIADARRHASSALFLDNVSRGPDLEALDELPPSLVTLENLQILDLHGNRLSYFPEILTELPNLQRIDFRENGLRALPDWIDGFQNLQELRLDGNFIYDLPASLSNLSPELQISLNGNPLVPPLAAAWREGGSHGVMRYLRAKADGQVALNEAKLVLVGEGGVGKSSLLSALRDEPWMEDRLTTHGVEIKQVVVRDPNTGIPITLNGWDFGGQPVYRPTHQMFFSAPAVYLVVWKPREGPEQGWVKDWIKLVKHRAPEARILVVATHGGPKARQPDIDRQEFWDYFGQDSVINFFHVDSSMRAPSGNPNCPGIAALREAIAREAAALPEMGHTYPKKWYLVRSKLKDSKEAYLPREKVIEFCHEEGIESDDANLLIRICHRIGDLIHHEHDPVLRHIVVVKPTWLATAISYVLDDAQTRETRGGLVSHEHLAKVWSDSDRDHQYPHHLHPIFQRLMERFDICYRISDDRAAGRGEASLIGQLVPDIRPEGRLAAVWPAEPAHGDSQQTQICRIVDGDFNATANAEGLFYQLIVRLHKYSLGQADFTQSVHWKRGLVLQDPIGGRAFLEHVENDVRISVRSPYPPSFLGALTMEVKWLVEHVWSGLRCDVTVPCRVSGPNGRRCRGLFSVEMLLEGKREGDTKVHCPACGVRQAIQELLTNSPASHPDPMSDLMSDPMAIHRLLKEVNGRLVGLQGGLGRLSGEVRGTAAKVEDVYQRLMRTLVDEGRDGPRLFTLEPLKPGFFSKPGWMAARYRLTLWCEHKRKPLSSFPGYEGRGVYELELPREWLIASAPYVKAISATLKLVLPVAGVASGMTLPEGDYKAIEEQLELAKTTAESLDEADERAGTWIPKSDGELQPPSGAILATGQVLRQLHGWLRKKDPGSVFGGLVRVQNKRQEFLWVHPDFADRF